MTYDTYESNEEMIAKLQAGATGYDIIVPTGYVVPVLVATGLIAPLHRKYLTNWGNLSPIFQNLPTDPGTRTPCRGSGARRGSPTGATR